MAVSRVTEVRFTLLDLHCYRQTGRGRMERNFLLLFGWLVLFVCFETESHTVA